MIPRGCGRGSETFLSQAKFPFRFGVDCDERQFASIKQTGKVLLSMPFSVMAGLVPAIHVVRLARGPKALSIGRQQRREGRCGRPTWMAGTRFYGGGRGI